MSTPNNKKGAARYLRNIMIAAALTLPFLSLAVLGTVWLWQNEAIIIWSVLATVAALLIYGLERLLLRRGGDDLEKFIGGRTDLEMDLAGEKSAVWTNRDQKAWAAVEEIAADVNPDSLNSSDAIIALGTNVVEAVARQMHPGEKDPLWKFTVPEALALVERTSAELKRFVIHNVPLGDRLTVRRLRTLYKWRSLIGAAEKAYDIWRILRVVNPTTALAGELRDKISGQFIDSMRAELTRRLARAYIREVGLAAIDLYGNRLRTNLSLRSRKNPTTHSAENAPIRLLLAGQSGAGKTSLVNALSGEVKAATDVIPTDEQDVVIYELRHKKKMFGHLIDTPDLLQNGEGVSQLVEHSMSCDLVLWVVSALRPDRAADAQALNAMRMAVVARDDLRPPPIIGVVTHIDRLRPFKEWQPPYDLGDRESAKSRSIRQALEAISADLSIEVEQIVPVSVGADTEPYNIDVLWARLLDLLPAAVATQVTRQISRSANVTVDWKQTWKQAVNAGRVIGRTVWKS